MSRAAPIIIIPTDRLNLKPIEPKILPNVQRDRSPPRAVPVRRAAEEAWVRPKRQKARVFVSDDSDDSANDIECSHSGNSTDDSSESVQEPKKRTENVRAVARAVAHDADDTDVVIDPNYIEVFWTTITGMNWKNKGERRMTNIPALNGNTRTIFRAVYKTIYKTTLEMLEADGMFGRNNISPQDKHVIVSHIIGLGRDPHSTLMSDMEFLQILVTSDECQSLDALLPGDIRQG